MGHQANLNLIRLLQEDEGLRLFPYRDTEGVLTIGYGRNLTSRGLRVSEADLLLTNDLDEACRQVEAAWPWTQDLNDARYAVLVSMCVNLGLTGLKKFRRTLTAMAAGRHEDAACFMLESLWARQVGRRALRLAEMWRTGEWPTEWKGGDGMAKKKKKC